MFDGDRVVTVQLFLKFERPVFFLQSKKKKKRKNSNVSQKHSVTDFYFILLFTSGNCVTIIRGMRINPTIAGRMLPTKLLLR